VVKPNESGQARVVKREWSNESGQRVVVKPNESGQARVVKPNESGQT
jgi:hypothetical protein